jgi:putative ABC transport system substrate-binding protein
VAPSLGIDVKAINVRDANEIERAIGLFGRVPNGGLILTSSALAIVHRELIIALAVKHKLPTVYYRRYFADSGGLASYGYDVTQQLVGPPSMSVASSRAKSPLTCRCSGSPK